MKNLVVLLMLLLVALSARAQYCGNSGTSVCTPQAVPDSIYWIWYPTNTLDCIVQDSFYSTTLVINNSSFIHFNNTSVYVQAIRVDSINNLPCGLCFRTNKVNNTVLHGDSMCVVISGLTESPPGQYNARVVLTLNFGNSSGGGTFSMPFRVRNAQGNCPAIDTASSAGIITDCTVGITKENLKSITATFAGNQLIISGVSTPCVLQFFNLQGQQIMQQPITENYTHSFPHLPAGMYIAVLTNSSGANKVIRLVKAG